MDVRNNLSSSVSFGGLAGFSCQYDTTKPQLCLRGMSVQTLHSPCSAYFCRSNTDQNNIHAVNPLNKFRIVSQMETVPDSFDKLDLTVTSGPVHDEYVPWSPDKESVDELFPILGNSLCSQSCLSENEPDTSEPTPAKRWNPDHHLTNLPAELAYPQNSRQVAVVDSLNLLQVTTDSPMNSANIVADKSSQAEHQRKRRKNAAYAQRERERQRERQRERRKNPAYAQRERERQRERQKERRKNPAYLQRLREHQRERQRELRKNPAYAQRERELKRERYQNDPSYAQRERKRQRERYHSDPTYAERQRKHCQSDPVCAKGRRIYNDTYNKMKISEEETSRLASVAREQYIRSVNSSEDTGNLPQTSDPA